MSGGHSLPGHQLPDQSIHICNTEEVSFQMFQEEMDSVEARTEVSQSLQLVWFPCSLVLGCGV